MIDPARCSFPIPTFTSEAEERAWSASLTGNQRSELHRLIQIERWGESVLNAPMDRTSFRVLTHDEFNAMKEAERSAEEEWRKANGWPSAF